MGSQKMRTKNVRRNKAKEKPLGQVSKLVQVDHFKLVQLSCSHKMFKV